jgi:hypothetical protein
MTLNSIQNECAYEEMESAAIYYSMAPTCPFPNVYGYITDTKMHYAMGGCCGRGGLVS